MTEDDNEVEKTLIPGASSTTTNYDTGDFFVTRIHFLILES